MAEAIKIDFKDSLYNKIYLPYVDSTHRYEFYYGGAGSGKSYFVAQKLIYHCLKDKYFRCVYGRKVARNIRDSCFKLLKEMIFEYGLEDEFTFNKSEMNIYCKNGNEFISFGSDDPEKVKSIVDPSHIWCEEFTDYNLDDYTQLNLRLRTEKADCLQFIGTFNPIDEKHWIKEELIDNEQIDKVVLRTTYKDNNFIDSDYKTVLGQLKGNDYIVYASGEWGVLKVQSPYMNAFDENLNVNKKAVFEPGKAIRLSFDFNVDNCVCVLSHAGLDHIHFFRELVSDNLPNLLTLVERTYGNYKASFVITGDRSGKARHHLVSDNMNSYRMIKKRLLLKDRQFNIKTNPPHSENRFTCNTILSYHPDVYFHPDMKETIYDMLYVECDQNEGIIKKDRNVSNQKADLLDAVRYTLNTFHADFVKKYRFKKTA